MFLSSPLFFECASSHKFSRDLIFFMFFFFLVIKVDIFVFVSAFAFALLSLFVKS